jgi:hypothetical protein
VNPVVPGRVIAGILGMSAFTIALLVGLSVGNAASVILSRALVAMIIGYTVGSIAGAVLEHVVHEYLRDYRSQNPVPDSAAYAARVATLKNTDGAEVSVDG